MKMLTAAAIPATCWLLLLVASGGEALLETVPAIDLTDYFAVTASSTCGDPPTFHEWPKNSGSLESCSGSEYPVNSVVDGNVSTRWQSANGDAAVNVTFTLEQV